MSVRDFDAQSRRRTSPIPPKPEDEVMHLFGRGMRERLPTLLAVNDRPVYVSVLARAVNSDYREVRQTLSVSTEMGMVVGIHSGPMKIRYIALNPAFPASP